MKVPMPNAAYGMGHGGNDDKNNSRRKLSARK
eukprot:CAMPEP_0204354416 /NCGR_PEP_ID=MMETSP0469-20131031/33388_1 /ASSEMBLY_ACC=CAM_ASM_000384 /TAXON_ID=2969 /ORGANISM="Oxyrrhis marina" /LENGTH=31 /DNA_ID= /DNA_START= /DNA_END= /DNA_ORIENTATION=